MDTADVAKSLRNWRKARGYTQADLASRSGVSQQVISEIERGVANPTLNVLTELAEGLEIPVAAIVGGPSVIDTIVRGAIAGSVLVPGLGTAIGGAIGAWAGSMMSAARKNAHDEWIANELLRRLAEITKSDEKNGK